MLINTTTQSESLEKIQKLGVIPRSSITAPAASASRLARTPEVLVKESRNLRGFALGQVPGPSLWNQGAP